MGVAAAQVGFDHELCNKLRVPGRKLRSLEGAARERRKRLRTDARRFA
jgi:hypothetical protein